MDNCHLIETAVFDISFASEEQAFTQQSELVSVCKNRLLAAIDEVFKEMSDPRNVIRIGALEIDLGPIDYNGFQDEMEVRLKEKLREMLRSQLAAQQIPLETLPAANSPVIAKLTKNQAEFEVVKHFLLSGCLPWNADPGNAQNFDQLLQRVVDSSSAQLLEFLRHLGPGASVISRLVKQFPDNILDDIVYKLRRFHDTSKNQYESLFSTLADEMARRKKTTRSIPGSTDIELLRGRLAKALVSGRTAGIKEYWPRLRSDYPELLIDALQYYGHSAKVRTNIANGFLLSMLKDTVTILQPSNSDFIGFVVNHPAFFQLNCSKRAENTPKLKRLLYEFSLTYMLVEQRTGLDKKAYLHSLVRQTAAHNNIAISEQYKAITEKLDTIKATDAKKQIKQELLELCSELTVVVNNEASTLNAELHSAKIIRAYDIYQKLDECLLNGKGFNWQADKTITFLDELAREHPLQLLRFYREMQSGVVSIDRLTAVLSVKELRALVKGWLIFINNGQVEGTSEFLAAIENFERSIKEVRYYYRQILECLIRNEPVDFEEILAEHLSSAETPSDVQNDVQNYLQKQTDNVKSIRRSPTTLTSRSEKAFTDYLKKGGELSSTKTNTAALIQTLELMMRQNPQRLRRLLETTLKEPDAAARIIKLLPERLLTRVLLLMRADEHHNIQSFSDCIANACYSQDIAIEPTRVNQLKWQFIFQYAFEEGRPFSEDSFVQHFVDFLTAHSKTQTNDMSALLSQQLALNIQPSTREIHRKILSRKASLTTVPDIDSQPTTSSYKDDSGEQEQELIKEQVYINNAGLVLAATYLPRLFERLDLTEHLRFKDRHAAERAVHLSQYLVNESVDSPEYQLVLNKMLCGVKPGLPIMREITIGDQEIQTIESLLQGLIQHWKTIGNTSVNGLRASFLQREGKLQLKDDTWHLLVEPRAYDMLLDQLPWSFSMIKHPWMDRPIHVDWR